LQRFFCNKGFGYGTRLSTILAITQLKNILSHLSIAENTETCKDSFKAKVLVAGYGYQQFWRLLNLKIFIVLVIL